MRKTTPTLRHRLDKTDACACLHSGHNSNLTTHLVVIIIKYASHTGCWCLLHSNEAVFLKMWGKKQTEITSYMQASQSLCWILQTTTWMWGAMGPVVWCHLLAAGHAFFSTWPQESTENHFQNKMYYHIIKSHSTNLMCQNISHLWTHTIATSPFAQSNCCPLLSWS